MSDVFLIVVALTWVGCSLFIARLSYVDQWRRTLLQKTVLAARQDLERGQTWEWRLEAFESVKFSTTVFTFWRPLDSLYSDQSFATPNYTEDGESLH